ncbi:MAG: hypothetical protein P1U85_08705 [Verrucomicrobiales bacterium]|nr:hypothetical protein [Verrucomicrobiales bacterium]
MRTLSLLLILFLFPGGFLSAAPEIYSDPRSGIEAAKNGNQLIIFLLVDGFSKEGKAIEEAVLDEIAEFEKEYVVVRCDARSSEDQALFKTRFGKDLSKSPMAVVSDSAGKEITGCYGVSPVLYRKMLIHSRIKGGFVKDKEAIKQLRERLVADAEEEDLVKGIFGIKISDLKGEKILMTAQRTWTYKNGDTFRAALLEGRGKTGIFVEESGAEREVSFVDLSDPDLQFLGTILTGGKTE